MLVSSRATRSRLHLLANDCAWRCGAAPGGTGRRRGLRVKIIVYGVILLLKLATTILYMRARGSRRAHPCAKATRCLEILRLSVHPSLKTSWACRKQCTTFQQQRPPGPCSAPFQRRVGDSLGEHGVLHARCSGRRRQLAARSSRAASSTTSAVACIALDPCCDGDTDDTPTGCLPKHPAPLPAQSPWRQKLKLRLQGSAKPPG